MEIDKYMAISDNCQKLIEQIIVENNIKTVVEFGSGKSTIMMDKLGVSVIAYETNDEYAELIKKSLTGTSKILKWDGSEVPVTPCDMVFIDGPKGKVTRGSAFEAAAKIKPKIIIMHDANNVYIKNYANRYLGDLYSVKNILEEKESGMSDTAVLTLEEGLSTGVLYKIAIAVPVADMVQPLAYFNHIHCFSEWSKKYNTIFLGLSGTKITAARNILTTQAIAADASHILFIDSDHIMPVDMLDKLIENADSAMVSGLICKRGYPYETVVFKFNKAAQLKQVMVEANGDILEVDACAMGCTLINLRKLSALNTPYFTDGHFRHDLNLCMKFKSELGASIKVDTRIEVGHLCNPTIVYPSNANLLRQRNMECDTTKVQS